MPLFDAYGRPIESDLGSNKPPEPPRPVAEQREPQNHADRGADEIRTVIGAEVQAIGEFVNTYNAAQRENTRQQWRLFWVQIAVATFTFFAFVAAAWYACIAERQWQTMNTQLTDYENAQAARLAVENVSLTTDGSEQELRFTINNEGNSMATQIVHNGTILESPVRFSEVMKSLCATVEPEIHGLSIPQGHEIPYREEFHTIPWYWAGNFAYKDIFGHDHVLPVCLVWHKQRVAHCEPTEEQLKSYHCN